MVVWNAAFGLELFVDLKSAAISLVLFLLYFFAVSILGWFCIGLPAHLLISRYCSRQLLWYLGVVLLFSVLIHVVFFLKAAVFLGGAALIQLIIFRYYTSKP